MKNILLVGLGGFIGSILRYLMGVWALRYFSTGFPLSTLTVNLTGSLLIGLLAGTILKPSSQTFQLFLMTGFCGGFTTFSTFSLEGLRLLRSACYTQYAWYVAISVIGGMGLCFLGFWISQKMGN